MNRELLELAAKAAGITLVWNDDRAGFAEPNACDMHDGNQWLTEWSPLDYDGDALRLAVKLNIWPVRVHRPDAIRVQKGSEYWTEIAEEEIFDDPLAATRRAIVRAAAEIGKGM